MAATTPPSFEAESAVPAALAAKFPQLEILHLVGEGGMGAVYCARQKTLNRLVALKVIKPESQSDKGFADRFVREAHALGQLSHPNIVTVHDFGQAGDIYYFIMEYVDGINLRQVLQGESLQPHQALSIVPAICDALQYAHDKGVVHRDIKPENILLDTEGNVKIADFGLAKLLNEDSVGATLTQAHQVMGTMHYMAPEQIERPLQVDHRADIYSLGVVIYELLTGELPLGRFAPPSKKVTLDIRLDEIVLQTLEKEPGLRYQKASDVKLDVQSLAQAGVSSPTPQREPAYHDYRQPLPTPPSRPVKPPRIDPYQFPGPIPNQGFWGVVTDVQSYKNLVYLLLSFPLGIIYFVLLTTGFSVGLGTLIIWIGAFVLLGTFLAVRGCVMLERGLATGLLRTYVAPRQAPSREGASAWERTKRLVIDSRTWLGILYLLVKFPLGIVSFVMLATLVSLPLGLLLTPLLVAFPWNEMTVGSWQVDTLAEASLFAIAGIPLSAVCLHTLNGVAWLHARWARLCIGQ
jgi:predicted Ser/Thr protein kinase